MRNREIFVHTVKKWTEIERKWHTFLEYKENSQKKFTDKIFIEHKMKVNLSKVFKMKIKTFLKV